MTVGVPPRTQPLLWKVDVLSAPSFQALGVGSRSATSTAGNPTTKHGLLFHRRTADHIQGICSAVSARHVHDGTLTCLINAVKTQCDHGKSVSHIDVWCSRTGTSRRRRPPHLTAWAPSLAHCPRTRAQLLTVFSSCLTGHRTEECHANGSDRERLHKKLFHGKWLLGYHMCTVFHFAVGWMALCAWPRVYLLNFIKKRKKGVSTCTWDLRPREMGHPSECRPPVT